MNTPRTNTACALLPQSLSHMKWVAAAFLMMGGLSAEASESSAGASLELLEFNVTQQNKEIKMNWVIAGDVQNTQVTVERSTDTRRVDETLPLQSSMATENTRILVAADMKPSKRLCYYRLRRTDANGESVYSEWVPVENNLALEAELERVFADRSTGMLFINCKNEEDLPIEVSILDQEGKVINTKYVDEAPADWSGAIRVGHLNPGIYTANILVGKKLVMGRFLF